MAVCISAVSVSLSLYCSLYRKTGDSFEKLRVSVCIKLLVTRSPPAVSSLVVSVYAKKPMHLKHLAYVALVCVCVCVCVCVRACAETRGQSGYR